MKVMARLNMPETFYFLLFQTHIFRQLRKSPGFFLIKPFPAQIPVYQYFAFDLAFCFSFISANLDSLGNAHLF